MVIGLKKSAAIKPREFYGSSLPRPRYFSNPQFNETRIDPPMDVMGPFLSWATEAHWSMGGLSTKRVRLQGRIEGNISKLRSQREKLPVQSSPAKVPAPETRKNNKRSGSGSGSGSEFGSDTPPPAPYANKRRKFVDLNDEDIEKEDEEEIPVGRKPRRVTARKLKDDFDRVATKNESNQVGVRTRSGRSSSSSSSVFSDVMKVVDEVNVESSKGKNIDSDEQIDNRSSPRLKKRRLRKISG